jgi:hypothetical protein
VAIAGVLTLLTPLRADDERGAVTAAIRNPATEALHPAPPRENATRRGTGGSASSNGWWLGTTGIVVALVAFGAISLASRRYLPSQESGSIRVIGRAALSSKHSVCLVRAHNRIVLVGVGPQGSPSLLGDWSEDTPGAEPENGARA